jgi:hypothetical protein
MIDYCELPDDGVRFEQFVRELLIREDFEVRWTGVGPDGGRDLLLTERIVGPLAPLERTWIVSCKHFAHSKRSVGANDLDRSIIDTCKAVGATGFLLACSTQVSSGLTTRFREIEQSNGIVCRAWDGVEIEKRLMQPRAFSLTSIFFPKTAASIPWSVYNAGSPSFWCGSHGGHFFYMSSRVPAGVPTLPDMERIVQMLNAIPLAPANDLGERERLRLRAVYFDNKNENYLVFADYLVPVAHPSRGGGVLVQSHDAGSLLKQLNDGYGLYEGAYRTNWDIMRVKVFQLSDRFDQDDKTHYTAFMSNFESGSPREGSASAFDRFFASWKS